MKIVKKIVVVAVCLLVIVVAATGAYALYLKPQYEGETQLKSIQDDTTVYFDEFGVPHIYAKNAKDAMVALGYVHAQDRLWQMELMRRIAPGRLSEIFGSVALKNDIFFAGLGIEEASAQAIAALDKNSASYQLAIAYLDGINQYLEDGKTPVEFSLLGISKEKFTLKDVYNIFGYMSFSFAMAQKTDPLLTDIRNKYGANYLKDLGVNGEFNTTKIKTTAENPQEYAAISKSITQLLDQSPVSPFIGSNSWVIAPKKTKNRKVIFANDPHIGFSQPGTWYEAHIVVPEFELYGCYLAGTPYPLLGHNRDYAYGLTMFENDDIDLYQEHPNPKNAQEYKTPTGYSTYVETTKTIKIKGDPDHILKVKTSRHGPIMNDLIDGLASNKPVALSWIYTQQPIHILDAVYSLSHAKSITDFKKGIELIAAPGLNVMYGDATGNVAWWATGKLYKHNKGVNPNFILDGASGKEDITSYLDFSKNPSAVNPAWGYVYSANNQPEAIDGFNYPGYYLPEDRAKRITQLLDSKPLWDKESVGNMMYDNVSAVAIDVVKDLLANCNTKTLSRSQKQAVSILKEWKGSTNLNDVAPTIYNKWVYHYLKNTFEDELGKEKFEMFLGTHIMKQTLATLLVNKNSVWWDNINTKNNKETREMIVLQSFKQAITALEKQLGPDIFAWTWNRVHTLEHEHPLSKVAVLKPVFNVGPFEVSGSSEVINNMFFSFSGSGEYHVKGGPSTRRVIDFSDIENSWSILPTGQSGNPMSAHYDDQAELYNAGKFRRMLLNKGEIERISTKLTFKPRK